MTEAGAVRDTHVFDEAVALSEVADGQFTGHPHPAFANMVGPFGGTTAAVLLRAVQQHPKRLGDPLSLTVNYAGPIADAPFDITVTPMRTNRSTQHWSLMLTQDGAVTTTGTAMFGTARPGWTSTEISAPDVPPAGDVAAYPMPDFVTWARNYDMCYVEGAFPEADSGQRPHSTSTLWLRQAPPRPLDFPGLAAMCDAFYPRIMLRRGGFVPAGTVSLTVYFHADAELVAAQDDDALLGTARAAHFGNGYFDQSARLWSRAGQLLATGHQLVYFKG